MRLQTGMLTDVLARAIVIVLLGLLSVNLLGDFLRTGHLTGLLLLASEALVILFTLIRRRAHAIDRSAAAAAATMVSVAGPPLLRVSEVPGLVPDMVTVWLSATGLALVIAGKLTLGRSFGIVPANRGVVASGPYNLIRHPIYAGYLITHAAFLMAHPRPRNIAIVLIADTALIVRALIEERVLAGDVDYQAYCKRVEWHLVPGVF
ncbi:MAG: isoprenylcysteine carboxylmethyltransferase family protein [Acidobacteria bacterium]|nr:isoprenylcysteine carboxylmethyltransferase family protein [Acidobacteriota bacterium]